MWQLPQFPLPQKIASPTATLPAAGVSMAYREAADVRRDAPDLIVGELAGYGGICVP